MTKKDYTMLMKELFARENMRKLIKFYLSVSGNKADKTIFHQVKAYAITNLDSRFDFHDPENSVLKGKIHFELKRRK